MKLVVPVLLLGVLILLSGCCMPNGGQRGSMVLEYDEAFDFDDMVYRVYETSCHTDSEGYNGIMYVPDIGASKFAFAGTSNPDSTCIGFDGLHCEEVSFGTFVKPKQNIADLGEVSLDNATVPMSPEFEYSFCAKIGHTYYLETWQDKEVLLEVKDITTEGIEVDYLVAEAGSMG